MIIPVTRLVELAAVTDRLAASESTLEGHRDTLQTKRDALQKLENEQRQQQETLRQTQSNAFAAAQQLSRVRNEINALDLQNVICVVPREHTRQVRNSHRRDLSAAFSRTPVVLE